MKNWSINSKVLALAILPTLVVSILLGGYFTIQSIRNVDTHLNSLGSSMIRQLSPAAKYALLSNNIQILQGLTNSALENPRITAAAIFNSKGKLLAFSGPDNLMPENLANYKEHVTHPDNNNINFLQPLTLQQITRNDYGQTGSNLRALTGKSLGWISLDISSTADSYIKIQTILVTLIIITLGLILSLFMIRIIMQTINRPLSRISRAIRHLQESNYSYNITELSGKEFKRISISLNKLKHKLQYIEDHHNQSATEETNDLKQTLEEIEIQNIELNIALKNAQRDNRRKSEFIASLSHEIRTPMSSIIGFSNLLLESELSKYQKEYLVTIQKSANTLLAIINDILDFSKIEAGKFKLDNVPFDFMDTIDEVLQSLAPEAQRKRLELIPLTSPDIPHKIIGDPLRLKQITTNLVYNAIKFTEEGSISLKADLISLNENNLNIQISVTDTGIGLSEKDKKNLFKAFSQADISIARKFGGTGLGLVISKQLIEQMGGSIDIHSKSGIGTTIRFNLHFNTLNDTDLLKKQYKVIPQNVLIYEPHLLSRQAIKQSLQPRLKKLTIVDSLKKVREVLLAMDSNDLPNHIILGLASSELHNTLSAELLRFLKREYDIPVTVLINNSNEMIIKDLLGYGAGNCIVKPISTKKLLAIFSSKKTDTAKFETTKASKAKIEVIKEIKKPSQKFKILIADDNPANLKLITSLLENIGITPDSAVDGKVAFTHCQANKYDLIFLDLHMPIMGGVAATEAIRTKPNPNQTTPIIAISAFIANEDRASLLTIGFNELLIKPVDIKTLDCVIKKWTSSNTITKAEVLTEEIKQTAEQAPMALDLNKTIELSGGNKQLALEIIQMFMKELPSLQNNMQIAYQEKEWSSLQETIHKLHGSSRFCAMAELQQVAGDFEAVLHKNATDKFQLHFDLTNKAIQKLMKYVETEINFEAELATE